MTRPRTSTEWTLGLLALAVALAAFAAAAQRPNLQGTWKLNEDLTARMREEDRPQGRRAYDPVTQEKPAESKTGTR